MINIFFVVHNHSGCKTYADELIAYLSGQRELNFFKIYLHNSAIDEFTIEKKRGYTEVIIPNTIEKSDDIEYYQRAAQLLHSHFQKITNVICHINTPYHYPFAEAFKKFFSCKLFFTLHYLENFYYYMEFAQLKRNDLIITGIELLEKTIKISDHIICVTEFAKQTLIKFYKVDENKITTIYNGMRTPEEFISRKFKETVRQGFGFDTNDKILLYVGLLEPRKGIDELIGSFLLICEQVSNLKLIIVGSGNYDLYLQLAQKCPGRICFTGKLEKQSLYVIYQIADIGVIPSHYEQCSYVLLEMIHFCLPIIVTNVSGLNELVSDESTGLLCNVFPNNDGLLRLEADKYHLAEKFLKLLSNPKYAHDLANNALVIGRKRFSIENMGKSTFNVYKKNIKILANKVLHAKRRAFTEKPLIE